MGAVVLDQRPGGAENVFGRAVVLGEVKDFGFGIVFLEAQDVAEIRAAPRVDRLGHVSDDGEVLARLGEQPHEEVLDAVGVLILVNENVLKPSLPPAEDFRLALQQPDNFGEKVVKIQGPRLFELLLIERENPRHRFLERPFGQSGVLFLPDHFVFGAGDG